jgi:hypothetical protein
MVLREIAVTLGAVIVIVLAAGLKVHAFKPS